MDLDPPFISFTYRGPSQPPHELESIGAAPSGIVLAVLLQRCDWHKPASDGW
jgi:hypothetical protein